MRIKKSIMGIGLIAIAFSSGVHAQPAPEVNNLVRDLSELDWVRYGDAESYSLAIGDWWYQHATGDNKSPYRVPISDAGKGIFAIENDTSRTAPGMEKPYEAVTQQQGFTWGITDVENYNGINGTVTNTVSTAWDITLAALNSYLTVDNITYDPIMYFQNNQTNSTGTFDQSLAAWARAWVTDPTGTTIGSYLFTNDASPYALLTQGGGGEFLGDVTGWSSTDTAPKAGGTFLDTDFVLSGGAICVAYGDYPGQGDGGLDPATNPNALHPIPVACDTPVAALPAGYNAVSSPIAHNLGNDSFPYAIRFPELNALIAGLNTEPDLALYTLHVDIRLGCGNNPAYTSGAVGDACLTLTDNTPWGNALTNGPESAVIGALTADFPPPPRIPEPGILALLGLGLASLRFFRRKAA